MDGIAVAMIVESRATSPVQSMTAASTGPRSERNPTPALTCSCSASTQINDAFEPSGIPLRRSWPPPGIVDSLAGGELPRGERVEDLRRPCGGRDGIRVRGTHQWIPVEVEEDLGDSLLAQPAQIRADILIGTGEARPVGAAGVAE